MTKLQELIGLVEQASKSKHWNYNFVMMTWLSSSAKIQICRCPVEFDEPILSTGETICEFVSIDNQIEMSAICAKMRELIKEDEEIISKDEIELLCKRAWKYGKEETC